MAFTIRGNLGGRPVEVEWDDGQLTGDELVQLLVDARVRAGGRAVELTPTGPYFAPGVEQLAAAYATIVDVLDEVTDVEGDAPTVDTRDDVVY